MSREYTVKAALYSRNPKHTHQELRALLNEIVPGVFEDYPEGHWKDIQSRMLGPDYTSYVTVPVLLFEAEQRTHHPWGRSLWALGYALDEHDLTLEFAYIGQDWDTVECESSRGDGTHVLSLRRVIDIDKMGD